MSTSQSPFTEEHEAFRRSVRAWVEKELTPHALEWDRAGIFPREVFERAGELGFLGANHDPAWGGAGGDYWFVMAFTEELARSQNAGVNMALLVQAQIATPVIGALGTDEQKREFLVPALAGDRIGALGVSEPGCGSDVASIRTTARRVGDEYVI
ncbi:MAG: acyl-CoA dehydrogenase family protein, partial [Myxococcaceae bacterium]